jgi:hypothetical protein
MPYKYTFKKSSILNTSILTKLSLKKNILKVSKNFLNESTIHGLSPLVKEKSIFTKLMWFICFIV